MEQCACDTASRHQSSEGQQRARRHCLPGHTHHQPMKFFPLILLFFILVGLALPFVRRMPIVLALATGTLIKGSAATVYYYAADGKRHSFPNQATFDSWYASSRQKIVPVSDRELSTIPLGKNIVFKPGVKLIKITTDPKVSLSPYNPRQTMMPNSIGSNRLSKMKVPQASTHNRHPVIHVRESVSIDITRSLESFESCIHMLCDNANTGNQTIIQFFCLRERMVFSSLFWHLCVWMSGFHSFETSIHPSRDIVWNNPRNMVFVEYPFVVAPAGPGF